MKKLLLLVFMGLLCACNDTEIEPILGPQPRYLFSELNITQTIEGSASVVERRYNYEDGKLSSHTIDQTFTGGGLKVSFEITESTNSYTYGCFLKGNNYSNYYNVIYSVNNSVLATEAKYIYQEGDSRSYIIKYTGVEGKYYLKSITETIRDVEYYAVTFDYSRFGLGEIKLTQTLFGEERFQATFQITRNNKAGIPDVHFNDADLHPLDKHFEAIYGGLFGTFDYFISKIIKETKTGDFTINETIESTIELDADGYPHRITSVSDKSSKATKYFNFTFSEQ